MSMYHFGTICFPYCLEQQEDGTWLVMNREYQPLTFWNKKMGTGFRNEEWPIYLKIPGLTIDKINKIIAVGEGAHYHKVSKQLFLYDGPTNPLSQAKYRKDYFRRLEMLYSLKVTNDPNSRNYK